MSKERADHDRWFKELIITFFEEFIIAFFPNLHEEIAFSRLNFLSEEVYADIIEGEKGRLDILVETKLKNEDVAIIIHTEPQAYYQEDFAERMYLYYCYLFLKHRKPIIPIAVFSHERVVSEPDNYKISIPFFRIVDFQFLTLQLNKMKWRDYLKYENPVTTALLGNMQFSEEETLELKKEFVRLLLKLEERYDSARLLLVTRFFDKYVEINVEEEMEYFHEKERVKIMEMISRWELKGYEKGKEEGKEINKREMVIRLLNEGIDIKTIATVAQMTDEEVKEIKQNNHS